MKLEPTDLVEGDFLDADKKICFGTVLSNVVEDDLVKLLKHKMTTFLCFQRL